MIFIAIPLENFEKCNVLSVPIHKFLIRTDCRDFARGLIAPFYGLHKLFRFRSTLFTFDIKYTNGKSLTAVGLDD